MKKLMAAVLAMVLLSPAVAFAGSAATNAALGLSLRGLQSDHRWRRDLRWAAPGVRDAGSRLRSSGRVCASPGCLRPCARGRLRSARCRRGAAGVRPAPCDRPAPPRASGLRAPGSVLPALVASTDNSPSQSAADKIREGRRANLGAL